MLSSRLCSKKTPLHILIVLSAGTLLGAKAQAFPDMIRKGYNSCQSCHVSPGGGGVLTSYGRGVSAEIASFNPWEGSGSFAGVPQLESWPDPTGLFQTLTADFQVDWRSVTVRSQLEGGEPVTTTIPMQLAGEIAFHIGKTTDLVVGYGQYGPDASLESRSHYIQLRTSKFLSFRGGRFRPQYGLNLDDHTLPTRALTSQGSGQETLGAEAHFESERLSLTLTRVFGNEALIADTGRRWSFESERDEAVAFRMTGKLGPRHYLGLSAYHDSDQEIAAIFAATAPIKDFLYILIEADQIKREDLVTIILFGRVGCEALRGVLLQGEMSRVQDDFQERARYGLGVQLMPIPHLELKADARLETSQGQRVMSYLLMSHVWL